MEMKKLWLFIVVSFIAGFIWGRVFSLDILQCHLGPKIPLRQYGQMFSVDVIKDGDDIRVVDYKTGHLIFEYNRFKEADKEAFGEYEELLKDILRKDYEIN
jgi:hypothetical protein